MSTVRWAKIEAALCVAVACVAIPCLIGHVYGTNDEVLFRLIAEKQFLANDLSEYLVFINILLGRFLKGLYGLAPGWPWYDVLTQLTVAISAGVLFWTARQIPGQLRRNVLTVALMVSVSVAAASPHFTQTAALASAAGLTLIFRVVLVPHEQMRPLGIVAGIALLVVGGLYRDAAAQLVLILSTPMLLLAVSRSVNRTRWMVTCLALLAAVGLQLGAKRYDTAAYAQHPEWASFWLQNGSRNQIVDFGQFAHAVCRRDLEKRVTAADWSLNDLKMLRNFSFSNPQVFSAQRTSSLAQALRPCTTRSPKYIKAYLRWRTSHAPYSIIPMLLVLSLGVAVNFSRGMLVASCAYALFGVSVWLGMEMVFKPLPDTVTFSLGLLACCFVLAAMRRYPSDIAYSAGRSIIALSAVLLVSLTAIVGGSEHMRRRPLPGRDRAVLERALSERFDRILPFMTLTYVEYLVQPFEPIPPMLKTMRMGGWLDQTPFQQRDPVLRAGGDLFLDACRSPRQALLLNKIQLDLVSTYMREHFKEDVVFDEIVSSGSKGMRLVTCRLTKLGGVMSSSGSEKP